MLTLAAIASLSGSLHGIMTSAPRVTHALGTLGDLPRWFARVQPRFETPANSNLFFALFSAALVTSTMLGWTANLGGQIRHTEIGGSAASSGDSEDHDKR